MSLEVFVYILTALAALVIALTRLRLAGDAGGGRVSQPPSLVRAHTRTGVAALATWLVFLVFGGALGEDIAGVVGIIALGFWWWLALLGIGILIRWLPSRGRHSTGGQDDQWNAGPALSVLAHLGMLGGIAVFTYAYLTNIV